MSEERPPCSPLGLWAHTCSHVSFVICSLALVLLLQRVALTPLAWIPARAWEWSFLLNINIYVNLNSEDLAFTLGFWILIGLHCSQNKVQISSPIFQGLSHLLPSYTPMLMFLENLQTPFALSGWPWWVLYLFSSLWVECRHPHLPQTATYLLHEVFLTALCRSGPPPCEFL